MKYPFALPAPVLLPLVLLSTLVLHCANRATAPVAADAPDPAVYLADPTVFLHDGTYYLYGTGGRDADRGFEVYTSPDLREWSGPHGATDGYALHEDDAYGDRGFWAPQVFTRDGTFYMAYTANEQLAIAESDSPLGPFTQARQDSLPATTKQIDPFVFFDDDGKAYLYHVRLTNGNRVFVVEMTDDLRGIKPGTLRECLSAGEPWENTAGAEWPVAEGPTVRKHDGRYYLVYSANDFRNPDYAVGFAVSDSPLGPWRKYAGNPIMSRATLGVNGPGHGDVFADDRGGLHYVFHTHHADTTVAPRRTAVVPVRFVAGDTMDVLRVATQGFRYLRMRQ